MLRHRAAFLRPELLDSADLPEIDLPSLHSLLTAMPPEGELAERIIERLLPLNDALTAGEVFTTHPHATLLAITRRVQRAAGTSARRIGWVWLQGMNDRAEQVLSGDYLRHLTSSTALADMARLLGYDRAVVLDHGPLPWARALESVEDDVSGEERQVLLAFLMGLALSNPQPGSEPILELAFDPLHSALWTEKLAPRALSLLKRHLPEIWEWWAYCKRLELGVVRAFEEQGLDPERLARLTSDREILARLRFLRPQSTSRLEFVD
jgi:hypothetical protein